MTLLVTIFGGLLVALIMGFWLGARFVLGSAAERGFGRWNPQNRRWQWKMPNLTGWDKTGF